MFCVIGAGRRVCKVLFEEYRATQNSGGARSFSAQPFCVTPPGNQMTEKWMAEKWRPRLLRPGPRHLFMPLQHSLVEELTQPGGCPDGEAA
jgi:hypothetical protein